MIKAFFLDFYGTVVHEYVEVIKKITDIIYRTGKVNDKSEIGTFWWNDFQNMVNNSQGDTFETQRVLEEKSLKHTLQHFCSSADYLELSKLMFEHWIHPPIFEESKSFFEHSPIPIYIVSNIDTCDILKAIKYHDLNPISVFTSEDAKAYKPRKELFQLALKKTRLNANEVIHIGDSISSDIKGASALNIKALWINRFGKEVPSGVESIGNLLEAINRI